MSAANYLYLPASEALRWFKVLAVFRFAASQGEPLGFELPPGHLPLRIGANHEKVLILILDDQALLREAVGEYLAMQGYEVAGAGSGTEAMTLIENGLRPQLLLCDIVLPDIHGPGFAREARIMLPELKVLFISGHPQETLLSEISENEFLQKPFRLDTLARRVRNMITSTAH